jgi:hypothetical protein
VARRDATKTSFSHVSILHVSLLLKQMNLSLVNLFHASLTSILYNIPPHIRQGKLQMQKEKKNSLASALELAKRFGEILETVGGDR